MLIKPRLIKVVLFTVIITVAFTFCSKKIINTDGKIKEIPATIEARESVDYFEENLLRYRDDVYKPFINTVLFYKKGSEISLPFLELNSRDKLILSFDDLERGYKTYKYTLIHCDALWKPTLAFQSEYIDGFTDDFITVTKYSFNTLQPYSYYEVEFPNEKLMPKWSGNYILLVYEGDNRKNVVLTRRLMIFENRLPVSATVKAATAIDQRFTHQEVDFSINTASFPITDPNKNLKVIITQNSRSDNAIIGLTPKMIKGDILDYNYDDKNVFSGGNEFRKLDLRSLRAVIDPVYKIEYDSNHIFQVFVKLEPRKNFKVYVSEADINGKRIVKTYDGRDNSIEADYCWVHFTLPFSAPVVDGGIYILGDFNDGLYNSKVRMNYDYKAKSYKTSVYMKQGYYNYQFIYLRNGANVGDETYIEGSHFETENDYHIFIYYREPGSIFDRLVAIRTINSKITK